MSTYQFTKEDIQQLKTHGLTEKQVRHQLACFKKGIPYVKLAAPATSGNGIIRLNQNQLLNFIDLYDRSSVETVKFIPASGAATRMFKLLHQYLHTYNKSNPLNHPDQREALNPFIHNLEKLPFFPAVCAQMAAKLPSGYDHRSDKHKIQFIRFLLEDMNYDCLPKGLIPFHHYANKTVTAFEEHLKEAATYLGPSGPLKLHFTISPDHIDDFKAAFSKIKKQLEAHELHYEITYSFQNSSTDTVAVDLHNIPYRKNNGQLLIRPGGHGALIENLNQVEADIIFIKNIDNVVLEKDLSTVTQYKKALAGLLLTIQHKVFQLLNELEMTGCQEHLKETAEDLALEFFHRHKKFECTKEIVHFFNRPIRVCGMVKNEGEPGGGPFWVRSEDGTFTLQIIERSQIDTEDPKQATILENSTHFNPVDLVCGVRDYKGNKFNLHQFVAPEQGIITRKSKNGKIIKALELPGLWNGSMAHWNTIFVDVPLCTFNPVKTVLDLLRPSHQG